jgi:hypothetical protein
VCVCVCPVVATVLRAGAWVGRARTLFIRTAAGAGTGTSIAATVAAARGGGAGPGDDGGQPGGTGVSAIVVAAAGVLGAAPAFAAVHAQGPAEGGEAHGLMPPPTATPGAFYTRRRPLGGASNMAAAMKERLAERRARPTPLPNPLASPALPAATQGGGTQL